MNKDNILIIKSLRNKITLYKNVALLLLLMGLFFFFKKNYIFDSDTTSKSYIAHIKVENTIDSNNYNIKLLDKIAKNKNIKAVILEVDSPGGTVGGSEILYNKFSSISKRKPLVAMLDEMATSGGYMISLPAEHIVARNSTITGSIGVILQSADITGLANKIGIKLDSYKSSELKGAPSIFEKKTEKVNKAVDLVINDIYSFFVEILIKERKDKIKSIDLVTDGRIFTGRQALKFGLIDEIGNKTNALNYLYNKQKIKRGIPIIEVNIQKQQNKFENFLKNFISTKFNNKPMLYQKPFI